MLSVQAAWGNSAFLKNKRTIALLWNIKTRGYGIKTRGHFCFVSTHGLKMVSNGKIHRHQWNRMAGYMHAISNSTLLTAYYTTALLSLAQQKGTALLFKNKCTSPHPPAPLFLPPPLFCSHPSWIIRSATVVQTQFLYIQLGRQPPFLERFSAKKAYCTKHTCL